MDIILGIRIWDDEFYCSIDYPFSKEKLKKELEKKLKEQKIPFVNFENVKKGKI